MAATLTNAVGAAGSPVSGAVGMLGKVTGGGSGCKSGTTVPFMIQGTTSDPKFVPDVGDLAAGMLKSQLGCTGGVVSGATKGQSPADALSGITGLFGKKKNPKKPCQMDGSWAQSPPRQARCVASRDELCSSAIANFW